MVLGATSKPSGLSVSVSRGHGMTIKDIVVKRGKGEWESITGTCSACCQKSCEEISAINEQQSKIDVEVEAIANITKTREDAVLDFKSDLEAEFEKVKKLLKEVEEMTNGAKPTADTIPATKKPLQLFTSGGDDINDNKNNENTNPATTATPAPTEPKPKEPREITIPLEHPKDYIRLTGGKTPFEGRLEVRYNGMWGTVCDDRWDLTKENGNYDDVSKANKDVACKQLGFGKGVLWQSQGFDFRERGNYWNGKKEWFEFKAINDGLPAIVDELECWTGDEADLYVCGKNTDGFGKFWGVEKIKALNDCIDDCNGPNDCKSESDIYLRCESP